MREKLIDMINFARIEVERICNERFDCEDCPAAVHEGKCKAGYIADHLIANGVTIATDNNVGHKWIPVTERLPEHFGTFIVAVDERDNNRTVYVDCADFDYFAKRWKTWGYFEDGWKVTHWMPLPEPPEEDA